MKYYVIGADGAKYGPASLDELNRWIGEGRVTPNQMLEDELGARIIASSVPGLVFGAPAAPQYGGPQAGQPQYGQPQYGQPTMHQPGQEPHGNPPGYYPRGTGYIGDNGQSDLTQAYIFGALGIVCCPIVFSLMGLSAANRAEAKGNPGAKGAKILAYIGIILMILTILGWVVGGALG